MTLKIFKAKKAGKLANGWERGKGKTIHAVASDYEPVLPHIEALCGTKPKISWAPLHDDSGVTCPKCLKKLKSQ
jgi:hypothetical protein